MLRLDNRAARRLWLSVNGLTGAETGTPDVVAMITRLGFVQIDSIRNVTRAHHHILWSRNSSYREPMLWGLLGRADGLFEHFTHDASLLPMAMLPMWQRQFERQGARSAQSAWLACGLSQAEWQAMVDRIADEGPLSIRDFETEARRNEIWARAPHKNALDKMWYAGLLATARRENFVKYYDLAERVYPAELRNGPDPMTQIDWLCRAALDRLGFATAGEIARFWDAVTGNEARDWIATQPDLREIEVETADGGSYRAITADALLAQLPETIPATRMRLINPFDPTVRDRARLMRLFGFDYRNEIFVPQAKRRWGYYVYPLLQGDRFVGRTELKADRAKGWLQMTGFWPEPGSRWSAARFERFGAELRRFGRLAGVELSDFDQREPMKGIFHAT